MQEFLLNLAKSVTTLTRKVVSNKTFSTTRNKQKIFWDITTVFILYKIRHKACLNNIDKVKIVQMLSDHKPIL